MDWDRWGRWIDEKKHQQIVLVFFAIGTIVAILLYGVFFHATGPVCTHVVNIRGVNVCE